MMSKFTQDEIYLMLRNDFLSFVVKCFYTLHPNDVFIGNWHIYVTVHQLNRCMSGACKRLIVNLPPRSLKSFVISVCYPAYRLGLDPTHKFLTASYGQNLAEDFANKSRIIMGQDWYKAAFPRTVLSPLKNSASEIMTSEHGGRLVTSRDGRSTGFGCDTMILDDPLKATEANSTVHREGANSWFDNGLQSRLNNMNKGCIILNMQRLHENDLTGHLLKKGGWEHLCIQAIAESDQEIAIGEGEYHLIKEGDLLHEELYNRELLERLRSSTDSFTFAAQYQQSPVPVGGNLIPTATFKRYSAQPKAMGGDQIIQSWDTAFTQNKHSDYSVCTTWLIQQNRYLLLDVYREKLDYTSLLAAIAEQANSVSADLVLIEQASVGISLINDLQASTPLNVIGMPPTTNKVARMIPCTADIKGGRVYLPKDAVWLADFIKECSAFPHGTHDDQVDSLSQFLNYIREIQKRSDWTDRFIIGLQEHKKQDSDMHKESKLQKRFRSVWM